MKAKICSNLVITLAVILFVSCDKSSETNDNAVFNFQRVGGFIGLNEKLTIDANTTCYSINYLEYIDGAWKPESFQTTIPTSDEQWKNLTGTFNLETFKKIKDGSCRACLDGEDETFSFTKAAKTYSIYNGDADENFQKMQEFFDIILEQIKSFEIMAGFRE